MVVNKMLLPAALHPLHSRLSLSPLAAEPQEYFTTSMIYTKGVHSQDKQEGRNSTTEHINHNTHTVA